MGVLNKAAGVVAPILFTAWVLSDLSQFDETSLAALNSVDREAQLDELVSRLVLPYLIMAAVLALLAVGVRWAPLPEPKQEKKSDRLSVFELKQYPHLLLGAVTLFCYVGVEVIAGDSIGLFGKAVGVEDFAQLTAYTMGFMVLGYVVGIAIIPRWISQQQALFGSALLGLIFSALVMVIDPGQTTVWPVLFFWLPQWSVPDVVLFLALLGLANALVWPTVWPLALKGLGPYTSMGSALLIMGVSGGAILPTMYGAMVDWMDSEQQAYILLLPCYLCILFYAVAGHKQKEI